MGLMDLYPDQVTPSVYDMDWERLAKRYKGVAFDIDNTLVPHDAPADARALELFERIHALGLRTALVSNNGEERVRLFAEQVQSGYVYDAGKPGTQGYERAMRQMGTDTDDTLFVGDQIFTDILGANRAGITTVLTDPVDRSTDILRIVIKRALEKPFRRPRRKSGQKG